MTNKEMGEIGEMEFCLEFEKEVKNIHFQKIEVIRWILDRLASRKELFDRWLDSRSLNDFYQLSRHWENELEFLDSLEYRRVEEVSRYNLWQCYLSMVLPIKDHAMNQVRKKIKEFISEDENTSARIERLKILYKTKGENND